MTVLMIEIMLLLLDINLEMLPIQQKSIMPDTKLWEKLKLIPDFVWSFEAECLLSFKLLS